MFWAAATAHNIRIRKELGTVAPVQGDPYTLQEVLFNLCTNALNAMPNGGTLTLRTYALGSKDEDQMGSVAIDVSDTGIGIPRVNLERIFEPFFTTRARRRHRPGPGAVPDVDFRDGRPHRSPQRPGPRHHVHGDPEPVQRQAPPRAPDRTPSSEAGQTLWSAAIRRPPPQSFFASIASPSLRLPSRR